MPDSTKSVSDWQESATARLTELKMSLQSAKRDINEAIGSYPAPIPACDAQFNAFLDRRRRLTSGISRIDALLQACRVGSLKKAAFEAAMTSLQKEIHGGITDIVPCPSGNDGIIF